MFYGLIQRTRELGRRQTIAGINYLNGDDCQVVDQPAVVDSGPCVVYTNTGAAAGKSQTLPAQV